MPYGIQIFIFTYVFVTVLGMLLGTLGLASFTIITPTAFIVGQGLFAVALALGTVLGTNVRPVAAALWVGWIFIYLFSLQIPMYNGIIFAIFLAPMFLGIAMLMMEITRQ